MLELTKYCANYQVIVFLKSSIDFLFYSYNSIMFKTQKKIKVLNFF